MRHALAWCAVTLILNLSSNELVEYIGLMTMASQLHVHMQKTLIIENTMKLFIQNETTCF